MINTDFDYRLPWLATQAQFPDPTQAWGESSSTPGLLAIGGKLSASNLVKAYREGIFPWYSSEQPVLWWSPDPRMVLPTRGFKLHRSLRKTLQQFRDDRHCEIRVNSAFAQVVAACANTPREGQNGTWIVPEMTAAYSELHQQGHAHSIETWVKGELKGGLYCVGIGRAVFGESMFSHASDASKIALAALVCFCRQHQIDMIDCQQNTNHLASLGAREISRAAFTGQVRALVQQPAPLWRFEPAYWNHVLPPR